MLPIVISITMFTVSTYSGYSLVRDLSRCVRKTFEILLILSIFSYSNMRVGWLGRVYMWCEKMWGLVGWIDANFGSSHPANPSSTFLIPPSSPWSPLRGDGGLGLVGLSTLSLRRRVRWVSKVCFNFDPVYLQDGKGYLGYPTSCFYPLLYLYNNASCQHSFLSALLEYQTIENSLRILALTVHLEPNVSLDIHSYRYRDIEIKMLTDIWAILGVNVGKYSSTMEHFGLGIMKR